MRIAGAFVLLCALVTASAAERVTRPTPPSACHVQVHKAKLDVDTQKNVSRQKVVVVCKRTMHADVALDKDDGKSLWKALEKDLKAAKIAYATISQECLDNPLAAGCS